MMKIVFPLLAICFASKLAESFDQSNVKDIETDTPSEAFDPADKPTRAQERYFDFSIYFPDYVIDNPDGVLPPTVQYSKCVLERHNYYREAVGLQPLKWNSTLAKLAYETSTFFRNNDCYDFHRQPFNKDHWIGEDLWSITHLPAFFGDDRDLCIQAYDAVDAWYQEVRYYTYPLGDRRFDSCDPDMFVKYSHFIQVMWQTARGLGCSYAYCLDTSDYVAMPKLIINCYYDKPILMGSRVFSKWVAKRMNEWEGNKQFGGLKNCTVPE